MFGRKANLKQHMRHAHRISPSKSQPERTEGDDIPGGDWYACGDCGKAFESKIGLGLHRRSKHPAEYNQGTDVERSRPRWSQEESSLLAKMEARLVRGGAKFINQALWDAIQELPVAARFIHTFDSLKSHRRQQGYKEMVKTLLEGEGQGIESSFSQDSPQQGMNLSHEVGDAMDLDGSSLSNSEAGRLSAATDEPNLIGEHDEEPSEGIKGAEAHDARPAVLLVLANLIKKNTPKTYQGQRL